MQHRPQRIVGWRGFIDEDRGAVAAKSVHAVQHQAVQVDDEIGGRPEALDQRDRSAVGLVSIETGLAEQVASNHAVHALQHGRHQLGAGRPAAGAAGLAATTPTDAPARGG